MNQNQVIALNVDGNLLTKLAELLGGEVAEQVKGALASQGIVIPEAQVTPVAPVVESKPEVLFGALLDTKEDDFWTGTYNVKGASDISIYPDEDGNLQIGMENLDGETNEDTFFPSDEYDLSSTVASVTGDVLTITVGKWAEPVAFQTIEIEGFVPAEDYSDEDGDDDCCDCCGCKSER